MPVLPEIIKESVRGGFWDCSRSLTVPDLQCHLVRGATKSSGHGNMFYSKICEAFCSFKLVLAVGAVCLLLNVAVQGVLAVGNNSQPECW